MDTNNTDEECKFFIFDDVRNMTVERDMVKCTFLKVSHFKNLHENYKKIHFIQL